jgi:hypothetical protein
MNNRDRHGKSQKIPTVGPTRKTKSRNVLKDHEFLDEQTITMDLKPDSRNLLKSIAMAMTLLLRLIRWTGGVKYQRVKTRPSIYLYWWRVQEIRKSAWNVLHIPFSQREQLRKVPLYFKCLKGSCPAGHGYFEARFITSLKVASSSPLSTIRFKEPNRMTCWIILRNLQQIN